MAVEFKYQKLFPLGKDSASYRLLTKEFVSENEFEGRRMLKVAPEGLTRLAETAFKEVAHLLRTSHLELLAKILKDPEASPNDRYVALEMLKNAVISAEGVLPMCQDTGTAIDREKGAAGLDRNIGRGSPFKRGFQRLHKEFLALLPECSSVCVRGEKHGMQPTRSD